MITIRIYIEGVEFPVDEVIVHFSYTKRPYYEAILSNANPDFDGGGSAYIGYNPIDGDVVTFDLADPEDIFKNSGYIGYVDYTTIENFTDHSFYIGIRKVELKSSNSDSNHILTTDDKVQVRFIHIPYKGCWKHQIQKFPIWQRLDTNHDGIINVADFLVFVEHFGRIVDW